MASVLKYVLDVNSVQDVGLPAGTEILSCAEKDGQVVVYAIADADSENTVETETHRFYAFETGHELEGEWGISSDNFVGSCIAGDNCVHVFHSSEVIPSL